MDLLEKYEIPIVASALKLYLLELPDSLVSSHVYEIVKTIYTSTAQSASEQARVQVIQSALGQLRLANIATLDALVTHFTRLIDLTSADEAYVANLASVLAPCFLRPKTETGLSMAEKYNVRLVRDLLAHKDDIFGELKRQSSLTHTNSGSTRQARAVSTDESNRKEAMEERQRAIAAAKHAQATAGSSRSRQPSPAPSGRVPLSEGSSHRRDRSRGPETRFPISTASVHSPPEKRVMSPTSSSSTSTHRDSLTIPQSPPATRQTATTATISPPKQQNQSTSAPSQDPPRTNGSLHRPPPAEPDVATEMEPTIRERSTTGPNTRTSLLPTMSASISGPGDFGLPGEYYGGSAESPSASNAPGSKPTPTSTSSTQSKYSDAQSSAPGTTTSGDVQKKDSLGRNRGAYSRKPPPAGLQRQSLVGSAESPDKGVQLEDRPMDFD